MGLGWLVSEVLVGLMQWPENNKAIYRIRLVMAYHAIVMRGVQQSVPRWKMVFELLFPQFRSTLLAVLQGRGNKPADEMSVGQRRHQKKRSHQIADVNPFQRRKSSLSEDSKRIPKDWYWLRDDRSPHTKHFIYGTFIFNFRKQSDVRVVRDWISEQDNSTHSALRSRLLTFAFWRSSVRVSEC